VVVTTGRWQVLIAHSSLPQLSSPSGWAVGPDGSVCVVDFDGEFVQKLSAEGQSLARFLYVADTNNQRIQKLSQ
jgi:DNA-binding beta-propeller fold protein YncE